MQSSKVSKKIYTRHLKVTQPQAPDWEIASQRCKGLHVVLKGHIYSASQNT